MKKSDDTAAEDQQAVDLLNDWEDGTPKSFGNAFTEHFDGQPSCALENSPLEKWQLEKRKSLGLEDPTPKK